MGVWVQRCEAGYCGAWPGWPGLGCDGTGIPSLARGCILPQSAAVTSSGCWAVAASAGQRAMGSGSEGLARIQPSLGGWLQAGSGRCA
jgi:hypothetical protein